MKNLVEADLANENAKEEIRISIANKHDKAHLLHLQIDPTTAALLCGVKHYMKKIERSKMAMMVKALQYARLISLPVYSMILLTIIKMPGMYQIGQMKVGAMFLSQVWKLLQDPE